MGGLILLEGLVGEMMSQRANTHPARAIGFISLFASPVSGSTAGAMVRNSFGKLWWIGKFINKQIRSLARGEECDRLLTEVLHRIYAPSTEDSSARRIPIRMVMATRDAAVSSTDRNSANARYRNLPPLEFDYGHLDIKLPESHYDIRYRALTNDLQERLASCFKELCEQRVTGAPDSKEVAEIELEKRYGKMFRQRFVDAGGDPEANIRLYSSYVSIIVKSGMKEGRPAFDTANRAIIAMRRQGNLSDGR